MADEERPGSIKTQSAEGGNMRPIKNLHALLIGINRYKEDRNNLEGCVNDINALHTYLQAFCQGEGLSFFPKVLTDEAATRQGVIDGFQHFQSAVPGDVCLLYYSGHGSYAEAAREFWGDDPDFRHETIVCHDSRYPDEKGDLLDKELSYLIWDATQNKDIHFVSIMDCCHAGSNTKDADGDINIRKTEPYLTAKELEHYLGHKSYKEEFINGQRQLNAPKGKHISLAAAKNTETAKEKTIDKEKRGVFTHALIDALRASGNRLSYNELVSQADVRVRTRVEDQHPQVDANGLDKNGLFLDGALLPIPNYFLIGHDINDPLDRWMLNAGAIQGIAKGAQLTLEDGAVVTVTQVYPGQSAVEGLEDREKGPTFKAALTQVSRPGLKVAFAAGGRPETEKAIREAVREYSRFEIILVDDASEARYFMHTSDGQMTLARQENGRPVFQPIKGVGKAQVYKFLLCVSKLGRWVKVMELGNRHSQIDENDISVELRVVTDLSQTGNEAPTGLIENPYSTSDAREYHHQYVNGAWRPPASQSNVLQYDFIEGEWHPPQFQLKITNNNPDRHYWVSALYMGYELSIDNSLLSPVELEPENSVYLKNEADINIPLGILDEHHEQGLTETTEYLKLFISTAQINTDYYNQEGLENDEFTKGIDTKGPEEDWTIRTIPLTIVRPQHQGAISPEQPLELNALSLTAPKGFSAQAALVSPKEQTRSIGKPTPDMLPNNEVLQPFEIVAGLNESPGLSVLELFKADGKENIHADNPIRLKPGKGAAVEETIIPFGYDADTGLYYPLGYTNAEGEVVIEHLPDETPTGTRSLTGSIKIFFQKIAGTQSGDTSSSQAEVYPLLRQVVDMNVREPLSFEGNLKKLKAAVKEAQHIALFIHGITGDNLDSPKALLRAKDANGKLLSKFYDLVLAFDYENLNTPIEVTAEALGKRLASIGLGSEHQKELHVFAHSMGGLASRWFIEKLDGKKVIRHLVQLGTPNLGSAWSNVQEQASFLITLAVNGAAVLQPYVSPLAVLGRLGGKTQVTIRQMYPVTPGNEEDAQRFLGQLNNGTDPGIPYWIIAGNTERIPVKENRDTPRWKRLFNRVLQRGHYTLLDKLLFEKPNDIAVRVEHITGIPGTAHWKTPPSITEVPCDHISYFVDEHSLKALSSIVPQLFNNQ